MFTFTFKSGGAQSHVEGAASAAAFVKSYGDLIEATRKFSVRARWMSYRAKLALDVKPDGVLPGRDPALPNPADDAAVQSILESLSATRPVDCFHAWYMTTPDATKCIIAIRLCSVYTGDHWCWNPLAMCDILTSYTANVDVPADRVLVEAFKNLKVVPASNIASPDREALIKTYKGRDGVEREIGVNQAYTIVTIPVKTLASTLSEAQWMHQESHGILQWVRTIMKTNVFKLSMLKSKEQYAKALFDTSKKTNLPKFLADAIIRVAPMVALNDFVPPSYGAPIMTILMNSRLPAPKYTVGVPVHDVDGGDIDGIDSDGGVSVSGDASDGSIHSA